MIFKDLDQILKESLNNPRKERNEDYLDMGLAACKELSVLIQDNLGKSKLFDLLYEETILKRKEISNKLDLKGEKIQPRNKQELAGFKYNTSYYNNPKTELENKLFTKSDKIAFRLAVNNFFDGVSRFDYKMDADVYNAEFMLTDHLQKGKTSNDLSLLVNVPISIFSDQEQDELDKFYDNSISNLAKKELLFGSLLMDKNFYYEVSSNYPNEKQFDSYIDEAREHFNAAVNSDSISGMVKEVSKMKWYIINAKPLTNGTSSISDMMELSIMLSKGLMRYKEKNKFSTIPRDMEALLTNSPDRYADDYVRRSRVPNKISDFNKIVELSKDSSKKGNDRQIN